MARKIDSDDSGLGEEDYNDGGWINEELSEFFGSEDSVDNDGVDPEDEEPGDEGSSGRRTPKKSRR